MVDEVFQNLELHHWTYQCTVAAGDIEIAVYDAIIAHLYTMQIRDTIHDCTDKVRYYQHME